MPSISFEVRVKGNFLELFLDTFDAHIILDEEDEVEDNYFEYSFNGTERYEITIHLYSQLVDRMTQIYRKL